VGDLSDRLLTQTGELHGPAAELRGLGCGHPGLLSGAIFASDQVSGKPGHAPFIAAVTSLVAGYVGRSAPSTSSSPPPIPVPVPTPPAPPPSAPSPAPSAPSPPSKPPVDWQNNAYQVTCDRLVPAGVAAGLRGGTATISG
jgi:hypothetical protein